MVTVCVSVGGIFGVMNTMFAAVSQRIKDIGVLRLLGYARRQILVSFLLESLVIALVGGLVGCALGTVANGWTATCVVTGHTSGGKFVVLKLAVDAPILTVGVLVSLGLGLFGGLLPALLGHAAEAAGCAALIAAMSSRLNSGKPARMASHGSAAAK